MSYLFETAEHGALRQQIRRFAQEQVAPSASAWEDAEEFPRTLYQDAGAAGILGIGYPEALGGSGGMIEVVTSQGVFEGQKLILATGAWTNEILAQIGWQLPLTVTQEQVTYFAAEHLSQFMPGRFPAWIWLDDPCFYGVPVHGAPGVKVGQDVGGREVTPWNRTFEPDLGTLRRVMLFVERVLPELGGHLYSKPCLYTMTPDRDFIIDRVPNHPNVIVAADAAHGFKFAAVIGDIIADLASDAAPGFDLTSFAFDRPVLREPDPVRRFLT